MMYSYNRDEDKNVLVFIKGLGCEGLSFIQALMDNEQEM